MLRRAPRWRRRCEAWCFLHTVLSALPPAGSRCCRRCVSEAAATDEARKRGSAEQQGGSRQTAVAAAPAPARAPQGACCRSQTQTHTQSQVMSAFVCVWSTPRRYSAPASVAPGLLAVLHGGRLAPAFCVFLLAVREGQVAVLDHVLDLPLHRQHKQHQLRSTHSVRTRVASKHAARGVAPSTSAGWARRLPCEVRVSNDTRARIRRVTCLVCQRRRRRSWQSR